MSTFYSLFSEIYHLIQQKMA